MKSLGPIGVVVLGVVLAGLVGVLQAALLAALKRIGAPPEVVEEDLDPREVAKLLQIEQPLTFVGLFVVPLITVFGFEAAIKAAVGEPGTWVLVQGSEVLFLHVLAGVVLGLVVGNWVILRRHGSRALLVARELEAESAGGLGRTLHAQAHWVFVVLFALPLLLAINEYTVVGPASVSVYAGFPNSRQELPHSEIRRILKVRTTTLSGKLNSVVLYVRYQDDTVLTSRHPLEDPLNDLVGPKETLLEVAQHLSEASGVAIEEVTLPFESELRGITDRESYGYRPGR